MKNAADHKSINQPFNIESTKSNGRSDKDLTLRMLKIFLNTARKCGKNIQTSLKENKWKELQTIARKNIPTYCVMGLNELVGFLKYIERHALNKEKHKSIHKRMEEMNEKNYEAIEAVTKYIGLIQTENNAPEGYNYAC